MTKIVVDHESKDVSCGTISVIKTAVDYQAEQTKQSYHDSNYCAVYMMVVIACVPIVIHLLGDAMYHNDQA